jgi:HAD superfamily hydrolase (TIGR01549 family)
MSLSHIRAVSFDFYETLVHHAEGRGRGSRLKEYFAEQGWAHGPWEHRLLYDFLDGHHLEYHPHWSEERRDTYYASLAARVLERMDVRLVPRDAIRAHAREIWRIIGPTHLTIYADVVETLERLRRAGYPLAITSNWQCGLENFCIELGLRELVDHVIASAEVGSEKPDAVIFARTREALGGVAAHEVLHVGDSFTDDWEGGRAAGFEARLLRRYGPVEGPSVAAVARLTEVAEMLGA